MGDFYKIRCGEGVPGA